MKIGTPEWFSRAGSNKELVTISPNSFATCCLACIIRNGL